QAPEDKSHANNGAGSVGLSTSLECGALAPLWPKRRRVGALQGGVIIPSDSLPIIWGFLWRLIDSRILMKQKVRIAAGQGFWGDLLEAPVRQVEGGPIDYLMLDYLAEVTMSIMQ